jgi:maltokinase
MTAPSRLPELPLLLADWIPRQRWFAGKGREIAELRIADAHPLTETVHHVVVEVAYADRSGEELERYQVPVTELAEADPGRAYARIAVEGEDAGPYYYDALHEPEGTAALYALMRDFRRLGTLTGTAVAPLDDLTGLPIGAEQSNTSVVFGDAYIMKVFRKVAVGVNPDLELTRVLADAGSSHVAAPLGWIEDELDGQPTTLAVCSQFFKSGSEGWKLALASVRDLFAEADLHADEVGGDFAGESERLGAATAEVHALLAAHLTSRPARPDEFVTTSKRMLDQLETVTSVVPDIQPFADQLRRIFRALPELAGAPGPTVTVQRIHGDYHLGQVLRIDSGWLLLDFEGEPARPLAERVQLASPLRDVAGMLRSFDYASRFLLQDRAEAHNLAYRAEEWAERNRTAFCNGYAEAAGADPRDHAQLLRTFELDKAVYEVLYEARHRPTWVSIPLAAIERLVGQADASGGQR